MKIVGKIAGLILVIIGGMAVLLFDKISSLFFFLSPDGIINPYSMLQLKILLTAFGFIGLYIIFSNPINKLLVFFNKFITDSDRTGFLIKIIFVALALRILMALVCPFHLFGDYQVYDELGWHWANTGGYSVGDQPTAYRPVGYPFLLSRLYIIFGHHPEFAVMANIIFSVAIVILSYLIVQRIWKEQIARWTAIILAFFPGQILFVNLLATEIMFTVFFLTAIWFFISTDNGYRQKWLYLLGGGVALGLATLTRPLTQIYLIIPAMYWYLHSKNLKMTTINIFIALAGFAIVVTPWMMRNYNQLEKFTITTSGGVNFLAGNKPGAGMGWDNSVSEEFPEGNPSLEVYIDSVSWQRGWQYIRENPIVFIKRGILKTAFFYAVDLDATAFELIEAAENNQTDGYVILGVVTEIYYLMVLLFGILGLMLYFRKKSTWKGPGGFLFWSTILYWTVVHFIFYASGRYHFPIIPMISAFAALYLSSVCNRLNTELATKK